MHEVSRRYLDIGKALEKGERGLLIGSPTLQHGSEKILGVLNGRVPSVRFETADDEVTISAAPKPVADTTARIPSAGAYGAVMGRVQTLSNRGRLRFTLYDQLYDRAVSCYLHEGQQEIMRDLWDRIALVKRDPASGRPTSVRQIRAVTPREEGKPGDWRDAAGVLAFTGSKEPAEVTIRRLRDAQ